MTGPIAPPRSVPVSEIADPIGLLRRAGILMPADQERLIAIEEARYVLVKQDQGERWRCRECGGKHEFLTLLCTPRPWKGLRHGLYAYFKSVGGATVNDLSPAERASLKAETAGFGVYTLPSLADRHPRSAQALGTPDRDVDVIGWLIGTVEVISPAQAFQFAARINQRARQVVVKL